jgi:hypothetical protein
MKAARHLPYVSLTEVPMYPGSAEQKLAEPQSRVRSMRKRFTPSV